MFHAEWWFVEILRFMLISAVVLTAAVALLRFFTQPLERIRLVQTSLIAILAALLIGFLGLLPPLSLAVLPADTNLGAAEVRSVVGMAETSRYVTPAPSATAAEIHGRAQSSTNNITLEPVAVEVAGSAIPAPPIAEAIPWKRLFVIGFVFCSLANLLYLWFGWLVTRRLIATAESLPADAALRVERSVSEFPESAGVRFTHSASVKVPLVSGLWRPTVVLPTTLTDQDADPLELKHCLAHELSHVRQHDLLTWFVANLCQIFLWCQPGYWALRRELRIAQDQIADRYAADCTDDHAGYATTLMRFSRLQQRLLTGALTMSASKSNLYRRIEMLVDGPSPLILKTRKPLILVVGICLAGTAGLMTSFQLAPAAGTASTTEQSQSDPQAASDNQAEQNEPAVPKGEAAAQTSIEHSGVVVDADTGEPIPGVTVTVTRMNSGDWRELAVTESVTDEAGRYTFTIPPDQLEQRLLYIMFDIDHPDYAGRHCGSYGYAMIAKNLEAGEQPWFSEFKMVAGEKITGRLVDSSGRPVADAELRAQSRPKSGFDRVRSNAVDGTTGEDGSFELTVTRDGVASLSIIPRNHCMKHLELGERRGDLGDIVVANGISIEGIVQDAGGQPLEGLWVNLTPEDPGRESSYEMKRSSKTDAQGRFKTRPLQPGVYLAEVESMATGAIEKQKYANFGEDPPPAMFVPQTIAVAEKASRQPYLLRAVPHVLITCQFYKPDGEISEGHSPHLFGRFDDRTVFIQGAKRTGTGAYQLMAPHGMQDADLRFITNEQSALMVQFPDGELSPQVSYRFDKLESDILGIRVVRHEAAILKVRVVDPAGQDINDARTFGLYTVAEGTDDQTMMGSQIGFNREGNLLRLSSIVPNVEFKVEASSAGYQSKSERLTMEPGERKTITMTLPPVADPAAEEAADNR